MHHTTSCCMQFTFAKNHWILSTHSNATSKNVTWPHFSWPTLYVCVQVVFGQCCGHIKCLLSVTLLYRWTDAITLLGRHTESTLQDRATVWPRWTVSLSAAGRHGQTTWSRWDFIVHTALLINNHKCVCLHLKKWRAAYKCIYLQESLAKAKVSATAVRVWRPLGKKFTPNQREEHTRIVEKYIQRVTTLSLSSFVYLLLPPKSAKARKIIQKFELIAVQGHPRSSILVSIESAFQYQHSLYVAEKYI